MNGTQLDTDRPPQQTQPVTTFGTLRQAAVTRVLRQIARDLPVRIVMGERTLGGGHSGHPTIVVSQPAAACGRLAQHPKLGLGEAYMAGEWEVAPGTDLADAMTPFAARMGSLLPAPIQALHNVFRRPLPAALANTLRGARTNVGAHYDLGNDFFATFLDPSMTYSSALFDPGQPLAEQDLHAAQLRKVDHALDLAGVGPGTALLEIGTGWGTLAIRAAQRGAKVTSITLSREQLAFAKGQAALAGVADRIDLRLLDYRQLSGSFDAVISIEMIEAVGEEYWSTYLQCIEAVLRPGGRCVIQSILMPHHRMLATRDSYGWIQHYIFPGGLIPSLPALRHRLSHTQLREQQTLHFGIHYAQTLRQWRTAFVLGQEQVRGLGFDDAFIRMWEFYLAYCEAGFAAGYLDVAQLVLRRNDE